MQRPRLNSHQPPRFSRSYAVRRVSFHPIRRSEPAKSVHLSNLVAESRASFRLLSGLGLNRLRVALFSSLCRSLSMKRLRNLELHVAHSCNLTCESCSHYSNQGHKGLLSLEEADHWMRLWNTRLDRPMRMANRGEAGRRALPSIAGNCSRARSGSAVPWPTSSSRTNVMAFRINGSPISNIRRFRQTVPTRS